MSPRRHHFSWGHHLSWDCNFNGSQLNCHMRSGTGKFSYSSASVPRRHHFPWEHYFNWGHSCISSQLNCHKATVFYIWSDYHSIKVNTSSTCLDMRAFQSCQWVWYYSLVFRVVIITRTRLDMVYGLPIKPII